jgi:hypothetical protein
MKTGAKACKPSAKAHSQKLTNFCDLNALQILDLAALASASHARAHLRVREERYGDAVYVEPRRSDAE